MKAKALIEFGLEGVSIAARKVSLDKKVSVDIFW